MIRFKWIRDLSIKHKIVAIILFVSFIMISLSFIFIATWDVNRLKNEIQSNLELNAKLVGNYCVVPLTFNDNQQATEVLSRLQYIDFIEAGCLYDNTGKLFATYPDSLNLNSLLHLSDLSENTYKDGHFYIKEAIVFQGQMYGTICIKASSSPLTAAKQTILLTLFSLLLVLVLLAFLLAGRLQRFISGPILTLNKHFNKITESQDFSVRLEKRNNDEIGSLYDGFNDMLTRIDVRQLELKESEEKHRSLIAKMINAFALHEIVYDADGEAFDYKILQVNPEWEKIVGVKSEAVLGKTIREIFPDIEDTWVERYVRIVETGVSEEFEDFSEVTGKYLQCYAYRTDSDQFAVIFNDTTHKKISERALKESEERFRTISENAPVLINSFDTNGKCLFWNKQSEKTFGWTFEEVREHNDPLSLFYPDPVIRAEVMLTVANDPDGIFREWHPFTKEGKRLSAMWANFGLPNGQIFSLGHDVTEQKQAELALRKSEEKLNLIINTSPIGICTVDNVGNLLSTNFAYEQMVGYSKEECQSLSFFDVTHPDDKPTNKRLFQSLFSLERQEFSMEKRYVCKDGSVIDVDVHAVGVLGASGDVRFGTAFVDDITDRKKAERALRESEEKLNALFSSLTEMVVMNDLVFDDAGEVVDYRIVDCNTVFTEFTGISAVDAIGHLASEVYQMMPPPHLGDFSRVALGGDAYEYTAYHPALDKHLIMSVVSPQKGKFATISTDISDMMEIQEMVDAKNKEMENYLYIASHDLRAPLVNIQGFSLRLKKQIDAIAALLKNVDLEPETQQLLGDITEENVPKTLSFILGNIEKMDTLINGLLRLSRTGSVKMTIKKVDVNVLLEEILKGLDFQIKEAQCEIHIDAMPECYGDIALLDQLFANLISNALKYANPKIALKISVSAKKSYNKVVYTIDDNGIGIPENRLDKIWDIFYRINPRAEKVGEGIGLSLVKRIAEKHKGRVWVESEEGQGSRFFIELNLHSFVEL